MQDSQLEIAPARLQPAESPIKAIDELKPGILKQALEQETQRRKINKEEGFPIVDYLKNAKPIDYLIVYGQGPVLAKETKDRPPPNTEVEAEANTWMRTSAKAAGELLLAGLVDKVILTGGRTGGELNPAEADLTEDILVNEYGIDKKRIIKNLAGNTFQNFAFTINQIDEEKVKLEKESITIAFLASNFHLPRVRSLANFFGVPEHIAFSSEQIFKLIAYLTDNNDLHQLIDKRLDMDSDLSVPVNPELPPPPENSKNRAAFQNYDQTPRMRSWREFVGELQSLTKEALAKLPSRSLLARYKKSPSHPEFIPAAAQKATYFEQQKGQEARGVRERYLFEKFLARGFLDPEVVGFWKGFLADLNDERLKEALKVNKTILEADGITPDTPLEKVREILKPYQLGKVKGGNRVLLEGHFGLEDYPEDVTRRLEELAK